MGTPAEPKSTRRSAWATRRRREYRRGSGVKPLLQVEVGEVVELANESGPGFGREGLADFFVGGDAGLDELLVELVAFGSEGEEQGAAGGSFFLGEEAFADQGFNGAMDDGAIETEKLGDLILVEGRAATKAGENEGARRGASGFAFELLAEGEIGRGEVIEYGIFQDVFGNGFRVYGKSQKALPQGLKPD